MASAPTDDIAAVPDRGRMQRDRVERLRTLMHDQGLEALVLLGNANVVYATGVVWPFADAGRTLFERPVGVVLAGDPSPHLFTPLRADDRVREVLPRDHVHGAVHLDVDEGVEAFASLLAELVPSGATVAIDEWTHALRRAGVVGGPDAAPLDGGRVVTAAKAVKTADELGFLRQGLAITEHAIAEVQARLVPGARQTDLTATFLGAVFEAGADANIVDPIWQVMPARLADGPWTTTGDVACPLLTTERVLEPGDVLWLDTGISFEGLHSDFGRTWIVGREPDARQRVQFDRWQTVVRAVLDVTRAGATAAELTAAATDAAGGEPPWMPHLYLGHGLGIDSAEMPYVGSDLGPAFDAQLVLEAGMVLVLEPTVWEDGAGGYRAEEVLAITHDGWVPMTDYPYDPF